MTFVISRFDDHLSYYHLERNFLERFGAVIPRQQMVQWVEKVAHLLLAIYWLIGEELPAGYSCKLMSHPSRCSTRRSKAKLPGAICGSTHDQGAMCS